MSDSAQGGKVIQVRLKEGARLGSRNGYRIQPRNGRLGAPRNAPGMSTLRGPQYDPEMDDGRRPRADRCRLRSTSSRCATFSSHRAESRVPPCLTQRFAWAAAGRTEPYISFCSHGCGPVRTDRTGTTCIQLVSSTFRTPCRRAMCAAGTPPEQHRSHAFTKKPRFTASHALVCMCNERFRWPPKRSSRRSLAAHGAQTRDLPLFPAHSREPAMGFQGTAVLLRVFDSRISLSGKRRAFPILKDP